MNAVRIHEPMSSESSLVDRKVVSTVGIPAENWQSNKPAEFLAAPLREHDAILGMPSLASEGILAYWRVMLPESDRPAGDKDVANEEIDSDRYTSVTPSICPILPKLIRSDTIWITARREFEAPLARTSHSKGSHCYIAFRSRKTQ